jgi:hypothetical protein
MPSTVHALKTWPIPFQAIWTGHKLYELRRDDRGYHVGDQLKLLEWVPVHTGSCDWVSDHCVKCNRKSEDPLDGSYTNRHISAEISYITKAGEFPGLEEGFLVLGIRVLELVSPQGQVVGV